MPRQTIPMSTKTIKVHVLGKKKVSLLVGGVTLHRTYQGFQLCFLVYPTDAQTVAPVGNQLLYPWNVVIWVISCSPVCGRQTV